MNLQFLTRASGSYYITFHFVHSRIISQSEDYVIVNKPPSIAVHPCGKWFDFPFLFDQIGRFRHNSLLFILNHEHGLSNLKIVHRLDRWAILSLIV